MNTTNQIAKLLEDNGIPFVRVEGTADGIDYWGLSVYHEDIHAEVRECSAWVEMKVFHFTPEQFINMLVGAGTTCVDETEAYEVVRDDMGGYGKRMTIHVMECEKCGRTYEHVNGGYGFCPHCRRRIEVGN